MLGKQSQVNWYQKYPVPNWIRCLDISEGLRLEPILSLCFLPSQNMRIEHKEANDISDPWIWLRVKAHFCSFNCLKKIKY